MYVFLENFFSRWWQDDTKWRVLMKLVRSLARCIEFVTDRDRPSQPNITRTDFSSAHNGESSAARRWTVCPVPSTERFYREMGRTQMMTGNFVRAFECHEAKHVTDVMLGDRNRLASRVPRGDLPVRGRQPCRRIQHGKVADFGICDTTHN